MKPTSVNILGCNYSIEYVDNPSNVDIYKRQSLWGQIDFWTRTIRIYDKDLSVEDVWQTLLHEIIHGICEQLHLRKFKDKDNHDDLDLLVLALMDVFFRNGWMK